MAAAAVVKSREERTFVPSLAEAAKVLQRELAADFEVVSCEVVDCPDLRQLGLASAGLCGNNRYLELGCVDNLLKADRRGLSWDLDELARKWLDRPEAVFTGAGACCRTKTGGVNAEGIYNHAVDGKHCSWMAKMDMERDEVVLAPHESGKVGMMGNFMVSDGRLGPVLRIRACGRKVRRGPDPQQKEVDNNFPYSIQQALIRGFGCGGDKQMALGGVFRILDGEFLAHVMPHGPFGEDGKQERDLADDADLAKWLNYYEWSGSQTLVACSTIVTGDPTPDQALNIRPLHAHFADPERKLGGHYHRDITPAGVQYEGYYNLCSHLVRLDFDLGDAKP